MIAREYGQDPREVATWPPDWIAAAQTVMAAENGAKEEIKAREERRARMQRMLKGGRGGR